MLKLRLCCAAGRFRVLATLRLLLRLFSFWDLAQRNPAAGQHVGEGPVIASTYEETCKSGLEAWNSLDPFFISSESCDTTQ